MRVKSNLKKTFSYIKKMFKCKLLVIIFIFCNIVCSNHAHTHRQQQSNETTARTHTHTLTHCSPHSSCVPQLELTQQPSYAQQHFRTNKNIVNTNTHTHTFNFGH